MKGADDIDIIYTALDSIMNDALKGVVRTSEEKQCTLRLAAYVLAINRVNTYYDSLGFTL